MKFKVRPNCQLNQTGDTKVAGDIVELSEGQYLEVRGVVEPVDEEAEAIARGVEPAEDVSKLRDHEKAQILENRKKILTEELAKVDKAMVKLEKENPKISFTKNPPRREAAPVSEPGPEEPRTK